MLSTLRRIVQEVSAARDLQAALDVIVRSVSVAMCVEVCSVYLYDEDTGCYTLMASEGLNSQAVGRVTLSRAEGLVGQIGLREEPINLEDAASHSGFFYLKETEEERYCSFLGVPIIHHRKLLGVLVIQRAEQRRFDESDESFLVTMSAQLAGVIAHAEATGSLHFPGSVHKPRQPLFSGVAGSPGIAIGTAVVLAPAADINVVADRNIDDVTLELALFREALASVRESMQDTAEKLSGQIPPEEQALFDVYLRMLDDKALGGEIEALIFQGQWAQGALKQVILEHIVLFEKMDDPYLRERAVDVRDLGQRVLAALQQQQKSEVVWPDNAIVISEELTPAVLGEIPRDKLIGLVSIRGSGNSHVAILARAMSIPTVMGAVDLPWEHIENHELIVDGNLGRVYASPGSELVEQYRNLVNEEEIFGKGLESLRDEPCITPDNYRLSLWVNTGLMADTVRSLEHGAEGVGLYRTEVPFIIRDRFPSEKEQEDIYREQLTSFAPRPVTIRTLDIGGDKSLSYFPIEEENPFLGWRGIRVTLDHPEIFLVQIRAMLKASEGLNNMRIMLPMVTGVPEVEEALYLIHRAYHEVLSEGANIQMPPIGVMIEVPAAIYQARDIARRVDFLSVGSNDLTQYILAVDRNNPRVADLYQPFHPAVLQALRKVVVDAHGEGKPVSICGEMAGDPAAAVLLMAMGFDVLSMNATNLSRVKWTLRNISLKHARQLLDEVLEMDNPRVIRSAVELELRHRGLDKVLGCRSQVNRL